jgi:hypothetical protein
VRARIAVHLDCLIRANTDSGLNSAKHGIATMPGEKVN